MRSAGSLAAMLLMAMGSGASAGAQQGGELSGYSAVAAGRAGSGGAAADNLMESARNPATLAMLLRDGSRGPSDQAFELDLRAFWAPARGHDARGNRFRADSSLAGGGWLGWATRVGEEAVLGLTLLPTFVGDIEVRRETVLDVGTPLRSREIVVDNHLLQVGLQPAVAWRPSESLSLGFGASVRHTRIGIQSAYGIDVLETFQGETGLVAGQTWGQLLSGPPFGIGSIQAEYDGDAENRLSASLQLGLLWEPRADTRVAVWYRSPSTASDLDGEVDVDIGPELGPILAFFGLSGASSYDLSFRNIRFPQQLGLGLSQDLGRRDRLHLDAAWTDWSATFDGFTARLTNPSNGDFITLVGGNGASELDLDLRWRDAYTWSLGYEHDLADDLTMRGGIGWASDTTAASVSPGSHVFNTWHVAVGASFWGGSGGDWHVALTAALPDRLRTGRNETLDDFSYDSYRVAIYTLAVAYTLRW